MVQKLFCVAVFMCSLIALVYSAPAELRPRPRVVKESFQQAENLEYSFAQQFDTGETFEEDGKLKSIDGHQPVIVTKGSYTVIEKDGSTVQVNYTADENGFHPEIVPISKGK